MPLEIVMPQMGYDMREGKVLRWLKKEGESVARGEAIAEIETDKATVELTAEAPGVLRKVVVPEGLVVPVGQVLAVITAPEETLPPDWKAPAPAGVAEAPPPQAPPAPRETPAPSRPAEVKASPLARKLAMEKGIDLTRVKGTGPGGRVTEKDVLAYEAEMKKAPAVAPPTPPEAPRVLELSRMRQAIARLTARAKQEIPHFYVTTEVDMGEAMALRQRLNQTLEAEGVRITVTDLLVKACALALLKFPSFNATFRGDKLEVHPAVHIGIAIALEEEGLIVPAILDCHRKSLVEIARASKDLIDRAHQRRLREQEYSGATFSISNLGMFDVESFAAIIHPPQSAVLATGAVRKVPVVRGDQVTVAQVMKATLSVDHRVADGAGAARFLSEVKRLLENPLSLLV